ncbi:MAG TPA: type II secretion system protein [Tepidisphaeraceae bacterium]|jgi:prepilin-type N-terminal cleavage/methylation domain-containing protein/prepilin-type processing-associated H-X9-DG protein|nr:type II secretion system protein [Tepidisphaeraceae bacterium]
MSPSARKRSPVRPPSGFTLIELLVVIGIVVLLISVLVPAAMSARSAARDTACASNVRQVTIALINYATVHHGRFPPNGTIQVGSWADGDRIGRFIGGGTVYDGTGAITAPVLRCPADDEPILRTYAMNFWASSHRDITYLTPPLLGTFFRQGAQPSSKLILVSEGWSYLRALTVPPGYAATDIIGHRGVAPGEKFVGLAAGGFWAGRWQMVESDLAYRLHRKRGVRAAAGAAVGRVHIGYLDGHVSLKSADDLGDRVTMKSKFDSLWSPYDYDLQ